MLCTHYLSDAEGFFSTAFSNLRLLPLLDIKTITRVISETATAMAISIEEAIPTDRPMSILLPLVSSTGDGVDVDSGEDDGVGIITDSDLTHSGSGTRSPEPFTFIQAVSDMKFMNNGGIRVCEGLTNVNVQISAAMIKGLDEISSVGTVDHRQTIRS